MINFNSLVFHVETFQELSPELSAIHFSSELHVQLITTACISLP